MDHLKQAEETYNSIDQELYKLRAIIGHEGPLKATDPNWKGSKYNDRIPSTTPGAEPPRDARDSGSARSHSMHLETSSSNRP